MLLVGVLRGDADIQFRSAALLCWWSVLKLDDRLGLRLRASTPELDRYVRALPLMHPKILRQLGKKSAYGAVRLASRDSPAAQFPPARVSKLYRDR